MLSIVANAKMNVSLIVWIACLMVVGLNQLELALVLGEKLLDVFRRLIVHDVQFRFETLCFEHLKLLFVCFKDGDIVKPRDRGCKDGVRFIMV